VRFGRSTIGGVLLAAIVFTHVTWIDIASGRLKRDATLRIASNVSRVLDGTGKFVIPGLWDMHTHVPDDDLGRSAYLPLFVANGVTGIRVMEGSTELYRWRDAIRRKELLGPRMVVASAIIDGPNSFLPDAVKVATPDEARKAVRDAKGKGADFVKVYDNLSPATYDAIIDESRERLPVAGHVPAALTVSYVSGAGQLTIEHMMGIAAAGTSVFVLLRKNHTWECPTLIMRRNYAYLDDRSLAEDPRLKYVRRSTREQWLGMIGQGDAERKRIFSHEKELVGQMARAGVGILAGTDNGNPFVFPGFSLHDELALLVDAGMTPVEALRTATINPAELLHVRSADFVILDANPLEDIHNTKKIHAVILHGHLFYRAMLYELLAC